MKRLNLSLFVVLLASAFILIPSLISSHPQASVEQPTVSLREPESMSSSTFVVNSTGDEPDLIPGDDICLTSAGTCTLRAAIQEANGDTIPDADTITFSVSSITPTSALPAITQPVTIDGSGGSPRVQLIGSTVGGTNQHALQLAAGSDGSTISAMVIRNWSGNGIRITSNNNKVENSYIGTSATGNSAQGNGAGGVVINSASGNTIGGTTSAQRNVISGNTGDGVAISNTTSSNTIAGNYIGIGADGTTDVGNTADGVSIGLASNQQIGGSTATPGTAPGNVISGNNSDGIEINGSGGAASGNNAQGNLIGTTAAGTAARRNEGNGVFISSAASNTVGGSASTLRNIISGHNNSATTDGVDIFGTASQTNTVAGNYIGTDINGTAGIGNGGDGVNIRGGADNNIVGGTTSGAGNLIAFNQENGVAIDSPTSINNRISSNSIHSNTSIGIDLGADGVTPNDAAPDADTGANNLQNFPVITAAQTGSTTIQGTLSSAFSTAFRIEFFSSPAPDSTGFGEGQTYLGFSNITTDASGNAVFTFTTATTVTTGHYLTATATDPNGNTSEFSQAFQLASATAIDLVSLRATIHKNGVLLEWRTSFEVDNLGFNIYRELDGERTLITPGIIAGSALLVGNTALTAGRSYYFVDHLPKGKREPRYFLEEIDLNGQSVTHPVNSFIDSSTTDLPKSVDENASILLANLGGPDPAEAAVSTVTVGATAAVPRLKPKLLRAQAAIVSQNALKISVTQEGWYRISQKDLVAAGLIRKSDPQFLQLMVDGREVPILVKGQNDGKLDPNDTVEFYGLGLDTAQTAARVYYLVAGSQAGKRITTLQGQTAQLAVASFPYTVQRKDRKIYFAALKNGDKENFFGPPITQTPVDQNLFVQHLDQSSMVQPVLEVLLQGATNVPHRVKVLLNGADLGEIVFSNQAQGSMKMVVEQSLVKEGDNQVRLVAQGGPSDTSLVDYVRLTYSHTFTADNDTLRLTVPGNSRITIGGFSNPSARVFDISNPDAVQEVAADVTGNKSAYSVTARITGSGQRTLLALADAQASRPASITTNEPSSLRQSGPGADFLIITTREFAESFESLRLLRQSEGLTVQIVDIEDVYDEFSFGQKTSQAIKDLLAYARSNWQKAPRFVLFAGDATLDPRNYTGKGNFDFVPTKLIETEQLETASDDWFADFNSDGVAEMAVGRLPIRSATEAASLAAKIINYDQSPSINRVLLVADRNDGFDFTSVNSRLKALVQDRTGVDEININITDSVTAKSLLFEKINAGTKIVNYAGHGASDMWRWETLTAADAASLTNAKLPMFMAMTCMNGFFHDTHIESLAEALMKSRGGAVAVWASSGMTFPNAQALMDQEAFRQLFSGQVTIGEATSRAKAAVADPDVRRTWILFGDPTTRLK